jgi:phosphate starvation-inducible PhoH-like protein
LNESKIRINVPSNHLMIGVLGQRDENLRLVQDNFENAEIHVRGNEITVSGSQATVVGQVFEEIVQMLEGGQRLEPPEVVRMIDMVKSDEKPSQVLTTPILKAPNGRVIRAKSAGQKAYVEAVRNNIITFAIGPAGTGKTWLAVAMAVEALLNKQVRRIVLTRPAVEAGERLGFLPGDLMAKVDPYLRPLYDSLYDMLDTEAVEKLFDRATVEVAPLAFMRGRTLNDSFIILDEAQNTTPEQMKMFLTRIGFGSRVVVTGDVTQIDVPGGKSGLIDVDGTLDDVEGIAFARLGGRDIVRHRIVQDIVNAYEKKTKGSQS